MSHNLFWFFRSDIDVEVLQERKPICVDDWEKLGLFGGTGANYVKDKTIFEMKEG